MRAIKFDATYFDKLKEIEQFYWAGYLTGRAYFDNTPGRKNTVSISANKKLISRFVKSINFKGKTRIIADTSILNMTSPLWLQRLKRLGIDRFDRKIPVNIQNHKFFPFYLRGLYEGKVNVNWSTTRFGTYALRFFGKPNFLKALKPILERKIGIEIPNKVQKIKAANSWFLPITRMTSMRKIIEYIYQPPPFSYNGRLLSRSKVVLNEIRELQDI